MRKLKYFIGVLFTLCSIYSCDSEFSFDNPSEPFVNGRGIIERQGATKIYVGDYTLVNVSPIGSDNKMTVNVVNGEIQVVSPAYNVVQLFDAVTNEFINNEIVKPASTLKSLTRADNENLTYLTVEKGDEANVSGYGKKFIKNYPEKKPNLDKLGEHDFLYVSDGRTINLYPIFSYTANCLALGVFYYDDNGQLIEQEIWEMNSDWYSKGRHVDGRQYYYEVNAETSTAIKLTLPSGTPFGFYVQCINGTNNGNTDKRHSASFLNTQNVCRNATNATHAACPNHCATYIEGDITYVGFEDGHSDYDYNDLIVVFDPEQKIVPSPTPDKIKDIIDDKNTTPIIEDDIFHVTNDSIDIEGRFREPYPYFRINVPIKKEGKIIIDIETLKEYVAEQDDFHIVTADDIIDDSVVKVTKEGTCFIVDAPSGIEEGKYQLKIELRPNNDSYERLIAIIKEMADGEYLF